MSDTFVIGQNQAAYVEWLSGLRYIQFEFKIAKATIPAGTPITFHLSDIPGTVNNLSAGKYNLNGQFFSQGGGTLGNKRGWFDLIGKQVTFQAPNIWVYSWTTAVLRVTVVADVIKASLRQKKPKAAPRRKSKLAKKTVRKARAT